MMQIVTVVLFWTLLGDQAFAAKPKYGPEAILLSRHHEYVRESAAPDFWRITPYYLPQQDDRSCSVASVAMIVNAARNAGSLTADDELVTQPSLLAKVNDASWTKGVGDGGHGVALDQLGTLIEKSLKAFGIEKASVSVVHTDDSSDKSKASLHQALVENEKSESDFIVINFNQGVFTGDADAGHIAPLAAYDSKRRRVLVMDPDRKWYEPYWVSEETLLRGMAMPDKESGRKRGYVWIQHLK